MGRAGSSCSSLIHALGAMSLLAGAVATVLSLFLAATQPSADPVDRLHWWFGEREHGLGWLPAFLREALHGAGPLATGRGFLAGYGLPLLVSTACALLLLCALHRRRDELSDADARYVLGWAIAFAIIAVPAFNVLTQDIWLSVAWGRMLNHGMNPFAHAYPRELAADLPLEYDPMPMTYGPWWAVVCSIAVAVSGGSPIAAWLALKVVLGVAWVACLWSVSEIARPLGAQRRALAIAVTGWLPLGAYCGVAEGHNDVFMVAAALLWARWLQRTSAAGPLLLSVSVLTKYVTAPLALVDAIYHWRKRTMTVGRYIARVLPAALLSIAGIALVALSASGLSETSAMRAWKFLDPADVFRLVGRYSGLPLGLFGVLLVAAAFGITALIELARLAKAPTAENARRAQLAVMAVILFAATGHIWPWFFLWCLPFAALTPEFWLSWFVIGAASVAPFTIIHWAHFAPEGPFRSELPSLIMYGMGTAFTATFLVRRRSAARVALVVIVFVAATFAIAPRARAQNVEPARRPVSPWVIPVSAAIGLGSGAAIGMVTGLTLLVANLDRDCSSTRSDCTGWWDFQYMSTGLLIGAGVGLAAGLTFGVIVYKSYDAPVQASLIPTRGGAETRLRVRF